MIFLLGITFLNIYLMHKNYDFSDKKLLIFETGNKKMVKL